MPPKDSAVLVVARFLKSHQYNESYHAFINEAGLPEDAGSLSKGDITLETLLDEKRTFDLSTRFEKLGSDDGDAGWKEPAPSIPREATAIPARSNILSATIANFAEEGLSSSKPRLLASAANQRVHVLDVPGCSLQNSLSGLLDSPILSCSVIRKSILLCTSMSGQLLASDLTGKAVDRRQDHTKYVVKVAVSDEGEEVLVATAGWDNKINIYRPSLARPFRFNSPIATLSLPSKPESIIFLLHPENSAPILIVSRSDSNHIFFYTVEKEIRLLGKQNLAPQSNAWVAFTPSSLEICPTDASLLAVGTSSVPHMKLLIVRLLFPPYEADPTPAAVAVRTSLLDDEPATATQASQARAALATANAEVAAIQIHCTTMAPQTAYSTPAIAWRPDGSGVWVNGDDGAIRGVEASSGKVVSVLKGHDNGCKVRCLWAGSLDQDDTSEEVLVSGGFDQKLILWKTSNA